MTFVSGPVPIVDDPNVQGALNLVWDRLQALEGEISFLYIEELHVPPDNPIEGMTVFADGTDWNPGATGRGLYRFSGTAWEKI